MRGVAGRKSAPPLAVSAASVFGEAAGRGRRRWALGLAVFGFSGHQLAEVMVPVAIGLVIDRAIGQQNPIALVWSILFLVAVFAVLITAWQLGARVGTRVYAIGEHSLRQRILRRSLLGTGRRRSAGETLTLSSGDTMQAAGIVWIVGEQAAALTAVLVACAVLFSIAWPLAVAVLVGTLVQGIVVHFLSGGLRRRGYAAQKQAARLDAVGADLTTGLRALEALGAAPRAAARYRAESEIAAEAAYRAELSEVSLRAVNTAVSGLVFTGIALLGGLLALQGDVTAGGFVAAMGLAQTIRWPLQTLGHLPGAIAAKYGSAQRIAEYLSEGEAPAAPPAVRSAGGRVMLRLGENDLEIRDGELTGIRCSAEQAVALTDLFAGRRPAQTGELRIGADDVAEMDAATLRAHVFAPPHDAAVFSGSARENIAEKVHAEHLVAAAFDEVEQRLAAGLDEHVGERGMRLSGGQRQRLLLARALHQPQPMLVLHEPTTAMDPLTEAAVVANLAAHCVGGRSIVLVSDRPSLLNACAVVLEPTQSFAKSKVVSQ